jgi:hypothetical protein
MKSLFSTIVLVNGLVLPVAVSGNSIAGERPDGVVRLVENAVDESAGGVACYRIETPTAVWLLEKSGAGLSSLVDRDGNDWIGFHPRPGSGASGEYRGFPNAVHQQAGNYFHPRNQATDPSVTTVVNNGPRRITITATASNQKWACRYDFYVTHCTFTMTKLPPGLNYWVLYEGTPGGQYNDSDWWMTSAIDQQSPLTQPHQGDIPNPEWIAFGDRQLNRVLVLLHHEDDGHADRFYQMQKKMTVFGFGRERLRKLLDSVPQRFSIGFVESSAHDKIGDEVENRWRQLK